jgi:CDP-glucose 4,6-dehydratase
MKKAVADQDFIFHLAAQTQVPLSVSNPVDTIDVSVNGTLNVIESLRKANQDTFLIFSSTDKVYGEPKRLPIDEDHQLSCKSPYDAAKLAADRLVYSYYKTYGIECGITRWSNTIGGRDANILRAAPDFITSIMEGKPPTIRHSGQHVRDFVYVEDSVRGMLAVAENRKKSAGEAFNLGTGRPMKIVEFANLTIKLMGFEKKMSPVLLNKPDSGEIQAQYLSSEKARRVLVWEPKFSVESGLKMTIDWYMKNRWWFDTMNKLSKHYGLRTVDPSKFVV